MKILKRTVWMMTMAVLFGICVGCTPKETSLWVTADEIKFEISYQAYDVVYDGVQRNFSVKNQEDFDTKLKAAEGFTKEMDYADSEKKAMLFQKEDELFFVFRIEDGKFGMRPARCSFFLEDGREFSIACPPLSKYEYAAGDGISVTQDWDYFSQFYRRITNAKIDESAREVELKTKNGTVTLVFKDTEIEIRTA